ncbi:major facilitator superfamily domain-containing protein [Ephemerocybe angulata]|uniref:Major facilitator superfamily domain-containing protein n=1 Tax=Ephemerocybe angulata TaxID=980116 RepID=A0A8H6HED2_9AGAR|nr:major facilitator superfamily domain-containing protein [Tulosesus angulatus]
MLGARRGGPNGWKWIFIIEGILTVVLGLLTWIFVPDFPDNNRFLTTEQTKMVLGRIEADRNDSVPDPITGRKILKHLSDPLVWSFAIMFMASTTPAYAIGFFITILLTSMGFNIKEALLLTAPPYLCRSGRILLLLRLARRQDEEAPTVVGRSNRHHHDRASRDWIRENERGTLLWSASGNVPAVLAYNANNIVSCRCYISAR